MDEGEWGAGGAAGLLGIVVVRQKNAPVLAQRIFIEFFRESDLRFSSIYEGTSSQAPSIHPSIHREDTMRLGNSWHTNRKFLETEHEQGKFFKLCC